MFKACQTPDRRFATCAALLCISFALGARAQDWKAHRYPETGFSADFPSEPALENRTQDAAGGAIQLHSYCAQIASTYLCVAVIDQASQGATPDPDFMLARVREGILNAAKTRIVAEKAVTLDDNKGIALETVNETNRTVTRFYAVGGTIYQTMVTCPAAENFSGTVRFLDSFRLIRRSGG